MDRGHAALSPRHGRHGLPSAEGKATWREALVDPRRFDLRADLYQHTEYGMKACLSRCWISQEGDGHASDVIKETSVSQRRQEGNCLQPEQVVV